MIRFVRQFLLVGKIVAYCIKSRFKCECRHGCETVAIAFLSIHLDAVVSFAIEKVPAIFSRFSAFRFRNALFWARGGARATNDNDVGSMLIRNRLFLPCYGGLEQPQCNGVRTSSSRFLSG